MRHIFKNVTKGMIEEKLKTLPESQMMSTVLAQPFLLTENNRTPGHDPKNWASLSILNNNLAFLLSPICCMGVHDDVWYSWLWTVKQQQIGPL